MELKNTTWALGETKTKTLEKKLGCWTKGKQTCKNGKIGKHTGC